MTQSPVAGARAAVEEDAPPPHSPSSLADRLEALLLPLGIALLVAGVWSFAVRASGTKVFPSPAAVGRAFGELARRGLLLRYIGDSLFRVGCGYSLAVAVGVPLGLAAGWYRSLGRALDPVVQLLRPISPIAWIPIAIVLFGVSNLATIFLIFLGAIFPVLTTTMNGVRTVPRMFLDAGRNFGLPPVALFARVVLPATLPRILTGLRIAFGIAWLVVVAAEMVAVDSGLGYLIIDARNAGKRYDLVVAGMLLIGAVGIILDAGMRRIETLRSVRWGFHRP